MDPGLLGNRYQIVRPIGTGDTTTVLEAWEPLADRRVAIKVPIGRFANDKAFLVRLEREVAALAQFTHPNIAAVHTVERGGGAGFVVAELVDGSNLRDMLAVRGPLPPLGAARVATRTCAALAAAHDRGIVHGHLTGANVLLTIDGQVKLTDFRLAQAARPLASAADPVADMRALGRLLAAMLTGREPADGEPVWLSPMVPPGLAAIVARADDPERPYHSAAELGRDLDRFLASVGSDAAPADQGDMTLAHDSTHVLAAMVAAMVASPAADPALSSAETAQLPVARGVARSPARRRRGLAVVAGLVGAGLIVGSAVAAVTLLDREPGGAAAGQAMAAPPAMLIPATTTSRPRPATTSTVTGQAPTTTAQPTIAAPVMAAPPTVIWRPTATTRQVVDPGQRTMPNVVGLRPQQAADVLAQVNLGMQILLYQVHDPDQVRRVIAQQPPAGQVAPAGSEVTVLVGTMRPTGGWRRKGGPE